MGILDFIWDWVYYLFYLPWGKKGKLVLIGLDNAGKTSTLCRLTTGRMSNPLPTYQPKMEDVVIGNLSASIFDVGGHLQARRIWKDYMVAVDGIVFMVDSTDKERIAEAKAELSKVLQETLSVPVLVFANKQDLSNALDENSLRQLLGLQLTSGKKTGKMEGKRSVELFLCSVVQEKGLFEGFTWLSNQM